MYSVKLSYNKHSIKAALIRKNTSIVSDNGNGYVKKSI